MALELKDEILIPASRDRVYAALNDAATLQRAIPGCEELIRHSDTELEAKVVLKSQWVFRATGPAAGIRDHLKQFLAPNDRLSVVRVDNTEWATLRQVTSIKAVVGP